MVKNIFICIVINIVIICAFILYRIFDNRRTVSRVNEGIGAADSHNQSTQRAVDDAKECGRVLAEGSEDLVDSSRGLAEESRKLSEDSEQITSTIGNISDGIKELSGSVERSKKILEQIGKQRVD